MTPCRQTACFPCTVSPFVHLWYVQTNIFLSSESVNFPGFKPGTWRWEGRTPSSPHPHKALIIIGPLCRLHASHRIQFMLYLCSLKRTLFLPHTPSLSPFRPTRLSIFISLFLSLPLCLSPSFHFWSFAVLNLCQLCQVSPSADNSVPSRCLCPRYQLFLYGIIRHITDLNTAKPYSFVFT